MDEPTRIGLTADDYRKRAEEMAERASRGELNTSPASIGSVYVEAGSGPAPVPRRFKTADMTQLEGDVAALANEWIVGDMSENVLLLGAVGTGKTHTACAMAKQAWDSGLSVSFLPVVELLDQLRPDGVKDALSRVVKVDVLVLDDLGGERPTEWTGERLYAVINRRWLEERPTIVTSNLSPDGLEKAVGPRVWSRLYHGALRLTVGGEDRRRVPA